MSNNFLNSTPFLRTSRSFPQEAGQLVVELNNTYIDTANAVNARTIGIFPVERAIVTGESWYVFRGRRQQSVRQVYNFTAAGNIAHGINTARIQGFVRIWGTFTDGTIWYPLPYVDVTAANNQINVIVDATNIVITAGGGTPPTIVSGWVILEWLSEV